MTAKKHDKEQSIKDSVGRIIRYAHERGGIGLTAAEHQALAAIADRAQEAIDARSP